ncbi:MAG: YgeY family selenium metabolism-linked hydrolase, partial [Chloroflexi bacterium]|nr:YgeY family selenium metabolism-linked hydrolase [Chloroflexota bacterium]
MLNSDQITSLQSQVHAHEEAILRFLREIVAIPSFDSQLAAVGERVAAEMKSLNFDEVRFDKMGNILGRIGSGEKVIVM